MELRPPPGLVWIDEPVPDCIFTGEPLEVREAELELGGTDDPPETVTMAWSEGAACWYALFQTLMEWSADAGLSPAEVTPFRVDGEERTAVVHFVAPDVTLAWDEFAERVDEAERRGEAPPPTDDEVAALPQLPETWQLAFGETAAVQDEEGLWEMTVAVVMDAGGHPRGVTMAPSPITADALAEAVRSATVPPMPIVTPARPREVLLADPALAEDVHAALAPTGIGVRHAPTPNADALLEDLQAHMLTHTSPRTLAPLFADASDDELRAFIRAATAFYRAKPWTRLDGDAFIAVQDADAGPDSPWIYASVMGQMDDSPGLGLFTRWLDVCAVVHGGIRAILESDAHLESVTLLPPDVLDPDEAGRLTALGATPLAEGELPVVVQMEDETMVASDFPLPLVTAMLTAIRETVGKRRARTISSIKTTASAEGSRLTLHYPARGDEALAASAPGVRLVVEGGGKQGDVFARMFGGDPDDEGFGPLHAGDRLIVEGPASTRAHTLAAAVERALRDARRFGAVTQIASDHGSIWKGRAYAREASPTLDHLASASGVKLSLGMSSYPVTAERLSTPVPTLRVEVTSA